MKDYIEQLKKVKEDVLALKAENAKLIAERDGYKVRGDGHWETLKSVREIAKEGDLERVIQWVNDAGGGYTEPNEMTLSKLMDENQKLLAEREQMMKQEPYGYVNRIGKRYFSPEEFACTNLNTDLLAIGEVVRVYARPLPAQQIPEGYDKLLEYWHASRNMYYLGVVSAEKEREYEDRYEKATSAVYAMLSASQPKGES